MKHLPYISIESILHKNHRYETVGDYYKDSAGDWRFKVSKMSNPDYEFLVIIHEIVEWYLTQSRGITEPSIAKFDKMFEKEREQGSHKDSDEPGFDPRAPYLQEHTYATKIEKLLAKELDIDWSVYDAEVMSL